MNENDGASQAPNIFYLDKIYSIKKQLQVFDILQAIHPTHSERLFLVGFLKYAGYSCDEVCDIIDKHCEWSDYNHDISAYQVATVFGQPHRTGNGNGNGGTHRRARKWQLTPAEEYRCKYYRTLASHRELQRFARENGVPVYDSAPELEFNPTKMEMKK